MIDVTPDPSLDARLRREAEHGRSTVAAHQPEYGWNSPAGKIRRARRADFLVRGLPRDAKVLEVGTGTGLQTAALLDAFDDVVGIDISPDLLEAARARAPGGRYFVMDAHRPDFPAESFDAIVGVSILHHLDWDLALARYRDLLRPGGAVRFSEPNLVNPQIFLQKNIPLLKRLAGDSRDEYAFSRGQIRRSLRRAGFDDVAVTPYEFLHPSTPERLIPLVVRVEDLIAKTPVNAIAGSLLIEARRPR